VEGIKERDGRNESTTEKKEQKNKKIWDRSIKDDLFLGYLTSLFQLN
jgi:hypothetical protein